LGYWLLAQNQNLFLQTMSGENNPQIVFQGLKAREI
jgi:hypothetical protein